MRRAVTAAASLAVTASGATAQTYTWTGGGSTANWSDGGNWAGGVAPVDSTTSTVVYNGSLRAGVQDIAGLDVGTIRSAGRFSGNPIRVNQGITSVANAPAGGNSPFQNPAFELVAPTLLDTTDPPASFYDVGTLTGSAALTVRGTSRVLNYRATGPMTTEAGTLFGATFDTVGSQDMDVNGLFDAFGTIRFAAGRRLDLRDGLFSPDDVINTAGAPEAGRLSVVGDVSLGRWNFQGYPANGVLADRLDVTGELDLTVASLVNVQAIRAEYYGAAAFDPPPAFATIASYGNRVGVLANADAGVPFSFSYYTPTTTRSYSGVGRIVYTSPANSGPGEIRILFPEPTAMLSAVSAFGLGSLRRRRRNIAGRCPSRRFVTSSTTSPPPASCAA